MRDKIGMRSLVVGVVIGALLGPVGAYAAGEFVQISSPNNRTAFVTRANQLQAAEVSPQFLRRGWSVTNANFCNPVLIAPGKSLIVKSVTVQTNSVTSPGASTWVAVYADTSCTAYIGHVTPTQIGVTVLPLGEGVAIPPGGGLYFARSGDVSAHVTAFGYELPSGAVPSSAAPAAGPAGPDLPRD